MTDPPNDAAPLAGEAGANESTTHNDSPAAEIGRFLNVLVEPDGVFEVRAPDCRHGDGPFASTVRGYYQHSQIGKAATDIAKLDASGLAGVIYVTLNPLKPSLLARAVNRLKHKAKETAADKDVLRRVWLLIDCDPIRPSGISATDTELELSRIKMEAVRAALTAAEWPDPVVIMSGNGYHLLYRIDLPTNDDGLVRRVLAALAARFDDNTVKIDRSVHNPARITKIAGTIAAGKGDSMTGIEGLDDRPHRRARLISVPTAIAVVSRALLETQAADAPDPKAALSGPQMSPTRPASTASRYATFDHTAVGVRGFLVGHGVTVKGEHRDGDKTLLFLAACPVDASCQSTGNSDIAVIVYDDGTIGYKNQHNRGEGLGWLDVREALEPGYKAFAQAAHAQTNGATTTETSDATADLVRSEPWDQPCPLHERVCPFPLADAFPPGTESTRDYLSAVAEAYQVPVDLPVMLALATAGLALSHRAIVRLGPEWVETPNQFNTVLLEPGNRKTRPFREVTQPIVDWERERATELAPVIAQENTELEIKRRRSERFKDLAAGKAPPRRNSNEPTGLDAQREAINLERELAEKKPIAAPQLIASDSTPEELARVMAASEERIGVFSDESETIEMLLGRYDDKPNFQIYNKGFDGSMHRVNRVSRAALILNNPLISIGLAIQPEGIRDMLANRKAKGTGLVARFAFSMPRSLLGSRRLNPAGIPPALRIGWHRTMRNLLEIDRNVVCGPVEVGLSAGAESAFREFCARIEPDLAWCGEFAEFNMQDWGGKLCGRIGRIALDLHGLRFGSGAVRSLAEPISLETMVAAIAWAPYLIDHARAAMGWIGVDDEVIAARRVLAWIARSSTNRFSKQECFTASRSTSTTLAEDVDRPLDLLCDLKYLRRLPDPPVKGPGRPPSPEFIVNPVWDRGSF